MRNNWKNCQTGIYTHYEYRVFRYSIFFHDNRDCFSSLRWQFISATLAWWRKDHTQISQWRLSESWKAWPESWRSANLSFTESCSRRTFPDYRYLFIRNSGNTGLVKSYNTGLVKKVFTNTFLWRYLESWKAKPES